MNTVTQLSKFWKCPLITKRYFHQLTLFPETSLGSLGILEKVEKIRPRDGEGVRCQFLPCTLWWEASSFLPLSSYGVVCHPPSSSWPIWVLACFLWTGPLLSNKHLTRTPGRWKMRSVSTTPSPASEIRAGRGTTSSSFSAVTGAHPALGISW